MRTEKQISPAEGGALPLLLLPGTLCDARIFGPLRDRLPSLDTRVVLPLRAQTMQEAVGQLLAEAPKHFALLGFSLGGMVAMAAALRAPERVAGLALLCTTPFAVAPELHAARRDAAQEARTLGMRKFFQDRLWPNYAGVPEDRAALPLLEAMAESLGDSVFAQQTELALNRADLREQVGALRCPVLVLGGEQDRVCPPEAHQALAAALKGCTSVMLPGAGHLPLLERADEVAAAVAAWFNAAKRSAEENTRAAMREITFRESE